MLSSPLLRADFPAKCANETWFCSEGNPRIYLVVMSPVFERSFIAAAIISSLGFDVMLHFLDLLVDPSDHFCLSADHAELLHRGVSKPGRCYMARYQY